MSRCSFLVLAVLLATGPQARARTWSDATGKFQIEGEFVQAKEGWIQLRRPDGKLMAIQADKLSQPDRDFVAELLAGKATPSEPEPQPELQPEPEPQPEVMPPAPAPDAKTGRFQTSFTERSPLVQAGSLLPRVHSPQEVTAMVNAMRAKTGKPLPEDTYFYAIEEQTYEVFVPEHYDGRLPFGLFVFINSSDSGGPSNGWTPVLSRHNLIFIGANNSGNEKNPPLLRIPLAVEAVHNMNEQYNIDSQRVYISGNSGGGRAASWAAMAFADVFTGGQYHVGANHYKNIASGKGVWPASIHLPSAQMFQHAKTNNRYVFLTGDKDFNREQMQKTHAALQADGFRYATYLQAPGAGHGGPSAEWFEKGITALDAPLKALAKENYDKAIKAAERGQLGPALVAIRSAAAHGHDQPFGPDAKEKLLKIAAKYEADVAAIEQAIELKQARMKRP